MSILTAGKRISPFDELPEAAKKYIDFIETRIGVQIKYISVGAERDSIITR